MPSNNICSHPINQNINLTFKQDDHSYTDNNKQKYISVTTLISKSFPQFDREKIAEQIAIKRHKTKQQLLKQWKDKSKEALRLGTRLHQTMEHYIKKQFQLMHKPQNILQKIKFDNGKKIINQIIQKYKPVSLEPEKVIFSPDFLIAGCIDLLVKIDDLHYIIFDWKCLSKDIQKVSFNNKKGHILPTFDLMDCNFIHYSLQVSIYQNILKSQNYINPKANVQRILIIWNGNKFKFEPTQFIPYSWAIMCWKNKFFKNI